MYFLPWCADAVSLAMDWGLWSNSAESVVKVQYPRIDIFGGCISFFESRCSLKGSPLQVLILQHNDCLRCKQQVGVRKTEEIIKQTAPCTDGAPESRTWSSFKLVMLLHCSSSNLQNPQPQTCSGGCVFFPAASVVLPMSSMSMNLVCFKRFLPSNVSLPRLANRKTNKQKKNLTKTKKKKTNA